MNLEIQVLAFDRQNKRCARIIHNELILQRDTIHTRFCLVVYYTNNGVIYSYYMKNKNTTLSEHL
jgi:hypothetical protein